MSFMSCPLCGEFIDTDDHACVPDVFTAAEACERLNALRTDAESQHYAADEILVRARRHVFPQVAEAYLDAKQRCGGFWYA